MEISIDELIEHQQQLIANRKGRKWLLALQIILSILLIICSIAFHDFFALVTIMATINSMLLTANYCIMADMRQEIENINAIVQHFKDYQDTQNIFNNKNYN